MEPAIYSQFPIKQVRRRQKAGKNRIKEKKKQCRKDDRKKKRKTKKKQNKKVNNDVQRLIVEDEQYIQLTFFMKTNE